jgi:PAS domain S-box-containing protein
MKWSITYKATTLAVIVLVFLTALGTIFYRQTLEEIEWSKAVAHTRQVLAGLESVRADVKEIEADERGFLLSGQDWLNAYDRACQSAKQDVAKVSALLQDSPPQEVELKGVSEELNRRIGSADQLIDLKRKVEKGEGAAKATYQAIASRETTGLSARLTQAIDRLKQEESSLLEARESSFKFASNNALRNIVILIIVALSLVILMVLLVQKFEQEQTLTQEGLRASAVNFLGVFNQSFEAIAILSLDGTVLQVNDTGIRVTGLKRENLIGVPFGKTEWWRFTPGLPEKIEELVTQAAKGRAARFETTMRWPGAKHPIDLDCTIKPVKDGQGAVTFLIAEAHDVTNLKRVQRALQESENKLRSIFENMGDGLYQTDREGKVVYLNPSAAQMLGYPPEEILGRVMHEVCHHTDLQGRPRPYQDCEIMRVMESGVSLQTEDVFVAKDGTVFPVRVHSTPVRVEGKVTGAVVTFENMANTQETERRSATLYSVTRTFAQMVSIEEASSKVLQYFCQNLDWDVGALWLLRQETGDLELVRTWHSGSGQLKDFDEKYKTKDSRDQICCRENAAFENAPLWIVDDGSESAEVFPHAGREAGLKTVLAFPLRHEENCIGVVELLCFQSRSADIGLLQILDVLGRQFGQFLERVEVVQKLKETEEIFQLLVNNVREVFWIGTADATRCIYVSPAYENEWGFSAQELYRTPGAILKAVVPEDRPKVIAHLSTENFPDDGREIEYRLKRPDGSERWIHARVWPIRDEDGEVIRLCGISRDITERKEMERRVSEFYSSVSHELRTPLTSIRAALGLIEGGLAGKVTDRASQLVKIARTESDRLIRLINDILDIRKIEAGKLELQIEPVQPSVLLESSLDACRGMADEAEVTIHCQVKADKDIPCDKDRVVQVITNLLSNAIKFSKSKTEVLVRVEQHDEFTRFSVDDKGPGIEKSQLHKLFEKFQQLDSSDTRLKGGTGLGLAISKAIIEEHAGKIGVDTAFGEGSSFWFELPNYAPIAITPLAMRKRSTLSKVLIVEDDLQLVELLKDLLAHDGFKVLSASSLSAASKIVDEEAPEVIILDLKLPDGNGLDWMVALREKPAGKEIPVIILTGRDSELYKYGHPRLIDWLKKPFDESRLLKALKVAVYARLKRVARVLVVDDDMPTRDFIVHQLKQLEVTCFEASDGEEALSLVRQEKPDLIILDIGIPHGDGFDVVQILRHEEAKDTPLIVYTSREIDPAEKDKLTLGLTRHLVKSRTSEEQFVSEVRELLSGLIVQEYTGAGRE